MSKSDTWMPFYVGDYLSATGRLTTEQHGAYLLILLDYWKNGPPPNDDGVLAALARLSPAAWRKAKLALIGFFDVQDGKLIQKRVENERNKASAITEERSKAGKAGAEKRWHNGHQVNGKRITNAIALPMANGKQSDAPSQSQGSNEPIASTNVDVSAEPTAEPPLTVDEVVDAWNQTAQRLGLVQVKKITRERQQRVLARIRENTIDDFKAALATIEQSPFLRGESRNGWKADFDFFVQKSSFTKLLEGSYVH